MGRRRSDDSDSVPVSQNGHACLDPRHPHAHHSENSADRKNRNSHRVFKASPPFTNWLIEQDPNFQSIYDAVLVQLLLFVAYVVIRDSFTAGRLTFDVSSLYSGLGSLAAIGLVLLVEAGLLGAAFLVHPALLLWKQLRSKLPSLPVDSVFVLLYVVYVSVSVSGVVWLIVTTPLPAYLSVVTSVEQLRLSMKSYSFVRENAYKVLYPWDKEDKSGPAVWYGGQMDPKVGSFSQYCYFLFAPTLLYRDHYPRNPGPVNWWNAAGYFIQFIATLFCITVIARDFLYPQSFSRAGLLHCYLMCMLFAFFMLVLAHTCVLHTYMNFAAEVLRFADRKFYSDWWMSTSFSSYYRKWNLLVHDWIHSYLYLDMKALFHHPLPAIFSTILISAIVHEYLLSMALGFFLPVLMLQFAGFGAIFYCLKPFNSRRKSNFFVVFLLSVGGAILIFCYTAEFAARHYCPKPLTWGTFFQPRIFECYVTLN